jgi:hypothetical protein
MDPIFRTRINHLQALSGEVGGCAGAVLNMGDVPTFEPRAEDALGEMARIADLLAKAGSPPVAEAVTDPELWWSGIEAGTRSLIVACRRLWEQSLHEAQYGKERQEAFAAYDRNRRAMQAACEKLFLEACKARPAEADPPPPPPPPDVDCYVTLDGMAAAVSRSKRTLEKLKGRKSRPLPNPDVEGGGGKPDEWKWSTVRPWLEEEYGKLLPDQFPAHRFRDARADRS